MPDWSRRTVLRAGAGGAVAAAAGGGWYLTQRPFCRPSVDPWWTYHGEHWGPATSTEDGVLAPEGYGVTGGSRYRLVALDGYYGQARWTSVATGGGFGRPTVHGDRVYVGTGLDTVRALDAGTGRVEWEYDAGGREEYGGGAWGRPLISDGRVYVGVSHADDADAGPSDPEQFVHRLVALDRTDGTEQWAAAVPTKLWAGAVRVADTVVAGTEGGTVSGFDPATGTGRWSTNLPAGLRRRPFVVGDAVTLVCEDGTVVFLDVREGTIRRTEELAGIRETRAVCRDGDTLLVGGASGRVVALGTKPSPDLTRWPVRWTYDAGVAVGAVTPGANETLVVDQSAHVHRVTDGERRGGRLRLVDDGGDERCGFVPNRRHVRAATVEESRLVVSSRWWLRSVEPDGD